MARTEEQTRATARTARPLVAFESFVFREKLCALTIHFIDAPAQLLAGEHSSVDLVLTPALARSLAQALLGTVGQAEDLAADEPLN